MSELDVLKEKIANMKLWLGIFVVTDISLVGWFASNYNKAEFYCFFWILLLYWLYPP